MLIFEQVPGARRILKADAMSGDLVMCACQHTAYPPRASKGGRQFIESSSPFACCAVDVVGPVGPKGGATVRGNRFIVTIVDYFSRWIEAFPITTPSAENIQKCLEKFSKGCNQSESVSPGGAGDLPYRLTVRRFVYAKRSFLDKMALSSTRNGQTCTNTLKKHLFY